MMEHIIDELLEQLSLSRANLIYSGGGHCYLLVPNTVQSKKIIQRKEEETNQWLLDTYGIALYVAGGYAECSANDLKNNPTGSYSELYRKVSRMISEKKSHRYGKKELIALNTQKTKGERECKVCRRIAAVSENGKCNICRNLEKMSGNILYENFFIVQSEIQEDALPLPGEKYLIADNEAGTKKRMETASYVRCYTKNRLFTGKRVATKLWVGDYTSQDTFEEFAQKAKGIDRIAVLRADVDNLGKTFMSGFVDKKGDDRYVTLSRTATLSRQLSLFFKYYISSILGDGEETRFGNTGKRNITIVYSGGDDVFLAGAWNDVIAAFIDLHKALERFSQGQIKISGGIEIYPAKYPVHVMAEQTADLEEKSKSIDGKNAITLFDETGTYTWDDFLNQVMKEKFETVNRFMEITNGYGKGFLYHLLIILRTEDGRFNRARYVYYLSRMEPDENSDENKKEAYKRFSRKMYEWAEDLKDRRQIITAIYLYVYLNRTSEEEEK